MTIPNEPRARLVLLAPSPDDQDRPRRGDRRLRNGRAADTPDRAVARPGRRGEGGAITFSYPKQISVIDRAAAVAAIGRYEAALEHVLQLVGAFGDVSDAEELRAVREAHAAAEAELEAADEALRQEIHRWRLVRLSPAMFY